MFRLFSEGPAEEKASKRTPIRLGMALIAVVGMLLAPLALAASAQVKSHATLQGSYVAVAPFRIVDTRTGATDPATYAGQTIASGGTLAVQVTGVGTTAVPTGALAAVLNVTAVGPTANGFLSLYAAPAATTEPTFSDLNFAPGETVANLVTVPLSATGGIEIYNHNGKTDVLVDVEGYYTATPLTNGSGLYNAISPVRALGTLAAGAAVAANSSVAIPVTGTTTGVPASATAVVGNVTAAGATASSFLSLYPAPAVTTEPTFSNLNFGIQKTNVAIANRVTVPIGTGGDIEVYNHAGSVNVDFDVDGYYTGIGGTGSVFTPITPVRVADTRTASLVGTETPIAANTTEKFVVATTTSGIPATATAVATNVTVVPADAAGYLTEFPTSTATNPVASDINWVANETPAVPNFTIADTAGTGDVNVYASPGASINVLMDAFGYFSTYVSGPIMVSAVVSDNEILVTYNEAVSCPQTATDVSTDFAYDWTGSASGNGILSCSPGTGFTTPAPDELELTPNSVFILPGSTGGSLIYSAPGSPTLVNSVYATSTSTLEGGQTLAVTAAAVPAMVSAIYTTAGTLVVTYNEDVSCANSADGDFVYTYSGVGTTSIAGCAGNGVGTDALTLTLGADTPPGTGAQLAYTVPSTGNSTTAAVTSVYASTATTPVYAATQTLPTADFTPPKMVSAMVASGAITVTYNNEVMNCPGATADGDFVYDYATGLSGGTITSCTAHGTDVLTLNSSGGLTLPGASGASLAYTEPTTDSQIASVFATVDYPQYPPTQTLALAANPAPAMIGATYNPAGAVVVSFNEAVTCAGGTADTDFVYDSSSGTSGGAITSCTNTGAGPAFQVTLAGAAAFTAPTSTASVIYTEPAAPSAATAVFATGTSVYSASQTQPLAVMVSAVVTTGVSIAITYSVPMSCPTPATGADAEFTYLSAIAVPGGTATGCTASGDVVTLSGAFNAPQGSASLAYAYTASTTTAVFGGTSTNQVYAPAQMISGAAL
ncbi:MAG: beta strand repeat-containing protein [Acidimicrobiales bacterium]